MMTFPSRRCQRTSFGESKGSSRKGFGKRKSRRESRRAGRTTLLQFCRGVQGQQPEKCKRAKSLQQMPPVKVDPPVLLQCSTKSTVIILMICSYLRAALPLLLHGCECVSTASGTQCSVQTRQYGSPLSLASVVSVRVCECVYVCVRCGAALKCFPIAAISALRHITKSTAGNPAKQEPKKTSARVCIRSCFSVTLGPDKCHRAKHFLKNYFTKGKKKILLLSAKIYRLPFDTGDTFGRRMLKECMGVGNAKVCYFGV